jgi:hypothetical protein
MKAIVRTTPKRSNRLWFGIAVGYVIFAVGRGDPRIKWFSRRVDNYDFYSLESLAESLKEDMVDYVLAEAGWELER